jgi:hypothetical protein
MVATRGAETCRSALSVEKEGTKKRGQGQGCQAKRVTHHVLAGGTWDLPCWPGEWNNSLPVLVFRYRLQYTQVPPLS